MRGGRRRFDFEESYSVHLKEWARSLRSSWLLRLISGPRTAQQHGSHGLSCALTRVFGTRKSRTLFSNEGFKLRMLCADLSGLRLSWRRWWRWRRYGEARPPVMRCVPLLRRRSGPPLLLLALLLVLCVYLMVGDEPVRSDVCYKVPSLQMLTRRFVCTLEALQRHAQVSISASHHDVILSGP